MTPAGELVVRASTSMCSDTVGIYAFVRTHDHKLAGSALIFGEPVDSNCAVPTTVHMQRNQAQRLFDDLWEAGFRPPNGAGGTAQVEAMREHIADLRNVLGLAS